MAWAHPVLFRRIETAKERNPALKIVVVDPRRTATADFADLHLAIEPGTDVALFHGLLHVMLWEEWIDADYIAAHTSGFADLKKRVREYTPAEVAGICGIRAEDLVHGGALVRRSERGAFALLPGAQSVVVRNREERGAHQSPSRDGPGRPPGRRAVLADGPAERDGRPRGRRHGDADVGASRPRERAAPRGSGGAVGRRRRARKAGQDGGGNVRRARGRRHQDDLDRVHESRAVDAGPGERARGARPGRSSSYCRRPTPTPRRRRSPTSCCPRRRGARRTAR